MSKIEGPVVWLEEYRTFARVLHSGAHTSEVAFVFEGELVTEEVENDEIKPWEDEVNDFESE